MSTKDRGERSHKETVRVRDAALKQALHMPPQPHKTASAKQRASETGRIAASKRATKR